MLSQNWQKLKHQQLHETSPVVASIKRSDRVENQTLSTKNKKIRRQKKRGFNKKQNKLIDSTKAIATLTQHEPTRLNVESNKLDVHSRTLNIDLKPEPKLGKYVAIDCEMVGVGPNGRQSALARVSIVNYEGDVIIDTHVKPKEFVTDYRTRFSGIRAKDLRNASKFEDVQARVSEILRDRVVIGHNIQNDFQVLLLSHPRSMIRDTSELPLFRLWSKGHSPALKLLADKILNRSIQKGEHDSVEDARASLDLFKRYRKEFDEFYLSPLMRSKKSAMAKS